MRFLFIVQGEGRGHMTQAISMQNLLLKNGHEVVKVLIGKSERRVIPDFFYQKINAPVESIESPNFILDKDNKGIRIFASVIYNLKKMPAYSRSIRHIHNEVKKHKPDVVINFYELLCGLYYLRFNPKIPHICIGHQFYLFHTEFIFPKGYWLDKRLLKIHTQFSSIRATKRLALSFTRKQDIPPKKIYVVPPLIREEILKLTPDDKGYILAYVLNRGYSQEIEQWHRNNKEIEVHLFGDNEEEEISLHKNLTFHKISDEKFIHYMKSCKGFASTAGFESVCEAMYLKKPIMMIPTAGHFEQRCNAFDAANAGGGIVAESFDLSELLRFIATEHKHDSSYNKWVLEAQSLFLWHLTSL